MEKTFRKVCQCEKCGNEAEMTITCSLEPDESPDQLQPSPPPGREPEQQGKRLGHAVCTRCGNEADMWLEL